MESLIAGLAGSTILGVNLVELLGIIWLSLKVSVSALAIVTLVGLPLAAFLALKNFPLRGAVINLFNTFMGLPPVVVGLFLYLILSRRGLLGFMNLLYTPAAMVLAQTILAFPLVVSLSHAALVKVDPIIRQAAMTLGATSRQQAVTIIQEARYGILAGVMAGLGRATAEVGAVIMVGGNIAGYTRVMTTTIALETDKGNFALAMALGIILLAISLLINLALRAVQKMGRTESGIILWD
ncbi:MAG: ABC transporter permease [Desulfobaccales bacterium]|nr:ABC transporter permease [Desulfobaccales bacterium]